jgi:hypothetical protein
MIHTRTTLVVGAAMLALSGLTVTASAAVIEAITIGATSGTLPLLAAGLGLWTLAERRKRIEKKARTER